MAGFCVSDTYLLTGGRTILPGFDGEAGDRIEIDMAAYDLTAGDDLGHRSEDGETVLFNRRTGQVVVRFPTATGDTPADAVRLLDGRGERLDWPARRPSRRTIARFDLMAAA